MFYKEELIYDYLCPLNGIIVDGKDHPSGRNRGITEEEKNPIGFNVPNLVFFILQLGIYYPIGDWGFVAWLCFT